MTTPRVKRDPAKYREMSVPFENFEKSEEAIEAFFREVSALREKHRIADVHVIISSNLLTDGGVETSAMGSMHLGNAHEAEGMCAWAYGQEQARREDFIRTLRSHRTRPTSGGESP